MKPGETGRHEEAAAGGSGQICGSGSGSGSRGGSGQCCGEKHELRRAQEGLVNVGLKVNGWRVAVKAALSRG